MDKHLVGRASQVIKVSRDLAQGFISRHLTATYLGKPRSPKPQLQFAPVAYHVKHSGQALQKKKFEQPGRQQKSKPVERKRRQGGGRGVLGEARDLQGFLVHQKAAVLRGRMDEQQLRKFQQDLTEKARLVGRGQLKNYALKMKSYLILHQILQKVLSLACKDTSTLALRNQKPQLYFRLKQEMVSILTGEQQSQIRQNLHQSHLRESDCQIVRVRPIKKGHYSQERSSTQLVGQIEDTMESAKRHLKEAFLLRGRPDFAYEIELPLDNRHTPLGTRTLPNHLYN